MKFSKLEIKQLLIAWIAITIVFGGPYDYSNLFASIDSLIITAITVGLGFLLHELAHKFVAQRFGFFAEFRYDMQWLLFGLVLALMNANFIIVAPGAVHIKGEITRQKHGIISLAGPATNFILGIGFILCAIFSGYSFLSYGATINAYIALFNLIPFGNFDGRKILNWNKPIYVASAILSIGLLILPII